MTPSWVEFWQNVRHGHNTTPADTTSILFQKRAGGALKCMQFTATSRDAPSDQHRLMSRYADKCNTINKLATPVCVAKCKHQNRYSSSWGQQQNDRSTNERSSTRQLLQLTQTSTVLCKLRCLHRTCTSQANAMHEPGNGEVTDMGHHQRIRK